MKGDIQIKFTIKTDGSKTTQFVTQRATVFWTCPTRVIADQQGWVKALTLRVGLGLYTQEMG